jgi:hypothetical protein
MSSNGSCDLSYDHAPISRNEQQVIVPSWWPNAPETLQIPRIYVTPLDTLAVVLSHSILVEISLQKNIRVCKIGAVAATIALGGRVAAIHHPAGEILQEEAYIYTDMPHGTRIRTTQDTVNIVPASVAHHHMWTVGGGTTRKTDVRKYDGARFSLRRDIDATVAVFLNEPQSNVVFFPPKRDRCILSAQQAYVFPNWPETKQLCMLMQGVKIRQDLKTGDVRVYSGRNYLALRADSSAVTVHSPWVDLNVDRWAQLRVRRAEQAVETTASQLTVTNGPDRASFDIWGDLVCFRSDAQTDEIDC